jgi:hypothetical protein
LNSKPLFSFSSELALKSGLGIANTIAMQLFNLLFTVLGLLSVSVNAFGFFDQMFGQQQQQQQQQQQNVRSDSSWYQAQYEAGMYLSTLLISLPPSVYHSSNCCTLMLMTHSTLLKLSLPRNPLLRTFPSPLSLRMGDC